MNLRHLSSDLQFIVVTWANGWGWARLGLRVGATSRGLRELLERSRRNWIDEAQLKWGHFNWEREQAIIRRCFFWLWIEVRSSRARSEIADQQRLLAEAHSNLFDEYVIWGERAREWGVEPTLFGIPESAVAALDL